MFKVAWRPAFPVGISSIEGGSVPYRNADEMKISMDVRILAEFIRMIV